MRKSNRKTKKSQSAKSGGQNRESQGNMIRSKPSKGPESKRGSACVVIFWAPTRLLAAQHTPMPGGGSTNCQKSKSRRIRFAGIPPGLGQRFVECAHYRGMLELSLAWLPTFVYLLQNPDIAGAADKAVNLVGCKSPHHQLPGRVVSISDACGGNDACSART